MQLSNDYMYAYKSNNEGDPLTVNSNDSTASLTFAHALTEVTFNVSTASNYGGNGKITSIALADSTSGSYLAGSGTMSLANGKQLLLQILPMRFYLPILIIRQKLFPY